MKRIASLALALALAPAAASAQTPPPAPDAAQMSQRFAQMRQLHQQMEQMHVQARSQMLAALSPAHRTLVANVVGSLAIASNPDPRVAAAQIDGFLTPAEKQSVVAIHTSASAAMRNAMEAARAQFEASASADQRAKMQQRASRMQQNRPPALTDPGAILLHSLGAGAHGPMGEMGHGPMGPMGAPPSR